MLGLVLLLVSFLGSYFYLYVMDKMNIRVFGNVDSLRFCVVLVGKSREKRLFVGSFGDRFKERSLNGCYM